MPNDNDLERIPSQGKDSDLERIGEHESPPPESWFTQTSKMGETLAKDALNIPLGMYKAVRHPLDTGAAILNRQAQEGVASLDAFKRGDIGQGVTRGLGYLTPIVGPMINEAGEELARGDTGAGSAHALEIFLPGAMEEAWGGKVKDFFKVSPETTAAKAWTPTPTQDRFLDNIKSTGAAIKKYGNGGRPIKTNAEAIAAAARANKTFSDAMDVWIDHGTKNGAIVRGDEIVQATYDALPETLKTENPAKVKVIMQRVRDAYAGKDIPVAKANELRSGKTADLKQFYNQSTGDKISDEIEGNSEAVVKAQRDAIAKALYRSLDPANDGLGPRTIGQRQKGIIDILDAARRRKNQSMASKPQSQFAGVASAVPRAVHSALGGTGMGYLKGAELMNPKTLFKGSVDPHVEKFFKAVPDYAGDIPRPQAFQPAGLLPPATKQLGPWITESGPEAGADVRFSGQGHQPYMGRGISPEIGNRMLPPASQMQQPGFSVESATGQQLGRKGLFKGGASNMVPVTDPVTGKIQYVPEWYATGQVDVGKALGGRTETTAARPFGKKLTKAQAEAMKNAAKAGPTSPPPVTVNDSLREVMDNFNKLIGPE